MAQTLKHYVPLRVTPAQHAWLEAKAAQQTISVSAALRQVLEQAMRGAPAHSVLDEMEVRFRRVLREEMPIGFSFRHQEDASSSREAPGGADPGPQTR